MKTRNRLRPEAVQQDIVSFWEKSKKSFCVLLIIHIIGISAIVRANVPYVDDVGRTAYGYRNFGFGRTLSRLLAALVHADTSARDVSPLTQLLAVCFLSAACCIVIHLLSEKQEYDLWTIIAVLPLGLSPYFLECLSYKFDSPYMALSILVSVLPFLFCKYGLFPYAAASIAGCLSMCMLYQASSGIYPMLTALLCFRQWNKDRPFKDTIRFGLVSAFSYCCALIVFRITFPPVNAVASAYVDYAFSLKQFPENLRTYFSYIRSDFKPWWLALIALIAASFIYAAVRDTARKPRVLSGLLAAVTLLVMFPLSYGAYGVLVSPWWQPRSMYGFGVFIAFIGVYASGARRVYPAKLACLCLSWAFVVFAFVYGNALSENQRYLEFRTEAAMRDMCGTEVFLSMEQSGIAPYVQYCGSIGWSPVIFRADDNFNLLARLVPNIVNENWAHGKVYVERYYGVGNYIIMDYSDDFRYLDLPILKDTFYHTIRGDGERILIEFKH